MTCGIHLIWTTYGTWLPGDDRGHWSALFDLYGSIRERGGKLNAPDDTTRTRVLGQLSEPPKRLDADEIAVIAEELRRHVAPAGPKAWAVAIEPNHVHLLIGPVDETLSKFAGRIKGRTSSVVGALPKNGGRERVWTSGFWKVFLFDDTGVTAVREYIEAHNVRRRLSAAPYPWIVPADL